MVRAATARLLIAIAVGCLLLALALRGGETERAWFLLINDAAWRRVPPAVLSCVTILGNGLCAAMLLAPTLLRGPDRIAAGLLAAPFGLLLSRVPKALFDSPRPAAVLDPASIHVNGMLLAGHNSLPSGHALTAALVVGVVLAGGPVRMRLPAALATALAGVAVALSRVAVGAHWPSDVLAGCGLGLLAAVAGAALSQRWRLGSGRAGRASLALIVMGCAVALACADLGYPLARPLQWLLATIGLVVAALTLWRVGGARAAPAQENR